jgi:hypothetical protein
MERGDQCQLVLRLPEDAELWAEVQMEGPRVPMLRVHDASQGSESTSTYDSPRRELGTFAVRPGEQAIPLRSCRSATIFEFSVANPGAARVAFEQVPTAKVRSDQNSPYGVFLRCGCRASEDNQPEEL